MNVEETIKNPDHYKLNDLPIESIDVVKAVVAGIDDGFKAYCVGNILKYLIRAERKMA